MGRGAGRAGGPAFRQVSVLVLRRDKHFHEVLGKPSTLELEISEKTQKGEE